jgi:RNA 2',3'-cyclic 3'-phosphodiesterase
LKNRLFVSLNLPSTVVEQMIDIRDSVSNDKNIRWEPKGKLHLTIKFIGDISSETTNEISNDLTFIENYSLIKCAFSKFGFFYRDGVPKILWVGLETDVFLKRLITELNEHLTKFSIPIDDRMFNPHITLLRIKNDPGINFVNSFKNFTFEPVLFNANSITLYKSILHQDGSKYQEITNYKLKELEI